MPTETKYIVHKDGFYRLKHTGTELWKVAHYLQDHTVEETMSMFSIHDNDVMGEVISFKIQGLAGLPLPYRGLVTVDATNEIVKVTDSNYDEIQKRLPSEQQTILEVGCVTWQIVFEDTYYGGVIVFPNNRAVVWIVSGTEWGNWDKQHDAIVLDSDGTKVVTRSVNTQLLRQLSL